MIDRRQFITGVATSLVSGAAYGAENLVMRRPPDAGEDMQWYGLGQNGPYNPNVEPILVPFKNARLMVHAPRGVKSGRLVVFSHGALNDPTVYRPVLQHWASHGFVVVAPIHDDSTFQSGLLTRQAGVRGDVTWEVSRVLNDALAWDSRCESCRLALEHSDLISKTVGFEVNIERPIIAGHEFGAYVVQLLMGAKVDVDFDRPLKFSDSRWYAGLMVSPQGAGIMGLTEHSWDAITQPFMVIEPGLDSDFTGQTQQQRLDPFWRSPPNYKHLALFPDARRNLPIGPRAGGGEKDLAQFENFKSISTAFLRAYADRDEDIFSKLLTDWPERATLGRVKTAYR